MPVAKTKPVNPSEEAPAEGEQPVSTLESLGIVEQEVVVGAPEQVAPAKEGIPTFQVRVNRDIDNMSHVGAFGAEHFSFEQGHVYDNVPWYIVEELDRIDAIWH